MMLPYFMKNKVRMKSITKIVSLGIFFLLLYYAMDAYQDFLDKTLNLENLRGPFVNGLTLLQMLISMSLAWVGFEIINLLGRLIIPSPLAGVNQHTVTSNRKVFWLIVFGIYLFITYLALFQPQTYHDLADEDHPVEALSAGLYFLAAGMFFAKAWIITKWKFSQKIFTFFVQV